MSAEFIHTRIWQEEAEPDNAFAAASCHCYGYDVMETAENPAGLLFPLPCVSAALPGYSI